MITRVMASQFMFFAVDNKNDDLCEQAAKALETSTVVCCVSGQLEPLKVKHAILLIALSSI